MLLALLAYRLHGTHVSAVTAAVLLMTCVPFLLHARQCRYYAVLVFAQIWLLWGLRQLLAGQSARGAVQIGLALVMQFYCNYIVMPGNVLASVLTGVLFRRRVRGFLPASAPRWRGFPFWRCRGFSMLPPETNCKHSIARPFATVLVYYLLEIHFHIIPWVLLLLPFGVAFLRWCRYQPATPVLSRFDWILWCFALSHLITLSICPLVFFRYLMPLIPVLILLATSVIERFLRPVPLRFGVLAVLALSNLVGWTTAFPVRGRTGWSGPCPIMSVR